MGDGFGVQLSVLSWPAALSTRRAGDLCTCDTSAEATAAIQDEVTAYFLTYRQGVYRYLLHLGCRTSDAQDVTQEAFVRLHRVRLNGQQLEDSHVLPWVITVARRLAFNLLTRQRLEQRLFSELSGTLSDTLPGDGRSCEEDLQDRERRATLLRAAAELTVLQRECLHLRAQGLSLDAIGRVVGLPLWSVRRAIHRAIRDLQRHVDDRE
jgi:RNA polymerase sigma factor (sigma-70 family)